MEYLNGFFTEKYHENGMKSYEKASMKIPVIFNASWPMEKH